MRASWKLLWVALLLTGACGRSAQPGGALSHGSDDDDGPGFRPATPSDPRSPVVDPDIGDPRPMMEPFWGEPMTAGTGDPWEPEDPFDPFGMSGPTPEECFYLASPSVSDGCRDCSCNAGPECPQAITDCDDDCWALMHCVAARCDGAADPRVCILDRCSDHLAGVTRSAAANPCYEVCAFDCRPPSEADAGVSDGGATDIDAGHVPASDAGAHDAGVQDEGDDDGGV